MGEGIGNLFQVTDHPPVVRPLFKFLHADTLNGRKVESQGQVAILQV
jgi:hypothetical protein